LYGIQRLGKNHYTSAGQLREKNCGRKDPHLAFFIRNICLAI